MIVSGKPPEQPPSPEREQRQSESSVPAHENVSAIARAAGASRTAIREWMDDPWFKAQVEQIVDRKIKMEARAESVRQARRAKMYRGLSRVVTEAAKSGG